MNTKHILVALALFSTPVFALANTGSLSIQSLSPAGTVAPGSQITMVMSPSGYSGAVTYSIADSLSGSSATSGNFSGDTFTWTPSVSDTGVHSLSITATDQSGNTATTYQQLTIMGSPTMTISSVSPNTTVSVGQTVTFYTTVTGFTVPQYSLTDSFGNTSLNTTAISSNGYFSWTPLAQDAGGHTITVFAYDALGDAANKAQTITVNPSAKLTIESLLPGVSTPYGQTVTFKVTQTGFTDPNYFASDSFTGGTVGNDNINASGVFTWVPLSGEIGSHTITVRAVDALGNTATTPVTIVITGLTPTATTTPTTTAAPAPTTLTSPTTTPPPTNGYKFTTSLALGSRSAAVTELQKRLIAKGYLSGSATGYFGALTKAAVMKYQKVKGIAQLGNVGPATRAALNAE